MKCRRCGSIMRAEYSTETQTLWKCPNSGCNHMRVEDKGNPSYDNKEQGYREYLVDQEDLKE